VGASAEAGAATAPTTNTRPVPSSRSQCHGHNFASRARCYQCGFDRPAGTGAPPPGGPGGGYGGGGGGGAPPLNWKPGDWMCGACNTHNFASRAACFRCGAAKQADAGGPAPPPMQ
jgi:hypothetical protein